MSGPVLVSGWTDAKFARLPEELITDAAVTDAAARLYGRLMLHLDYHDRAGDVWPGYERLAASLGWSEAKLGRNMKTLIAAGWAHRRRRPGTSSITFLCARKGQRPTWPEPSEDVNSDVVNNADLSGPNTSDLTGKRETGTESQLPPAPSPAPPATGKGSKAKWSDDARAIATAVWDRFTAESRTPNASSWQGIATVAQQLLDVGHKAEAIVDAIPASSVCTFNAVTITLGSRDVDDGGERKTPTVPPPPPPGVCPACVGHPKWEPVTPGDDESPMVPCRACQTDARARWVTQGRALSLEPPTAPEPTPGPPPRRDLD